MRVSLENNLCRCIERFTDRSKARKWVDRCKAWSARCRPYETMQTYFLGNISQENMEDISAISIYEKNPKVLMAHKNKPLFFTHSQM